jgi:hypothetical protein
VNLPRKIYHYSGQIIEKLESIPYQELETPKPDMKPIGLWVSIEDFEDDQTWKTWCEAEKFELQNLKYKYLIKIKDKNNILIINTVEQLEEFSLKYIDNSLGDVHNKYMDGLIGYIRKTPVFFIKWKDVMQEYDGIFIFPYQWSCRLLNPPTYWYCGWDCASGCIWNCEVIDSLQLIEENKFSIEENEKPIHTHVWTCF